jgi:hypothetical protein
MMWLGIVWLSCCIFGGLWFWYLHSKGNFVGEYPYDDEM